MKELKQNTLAEATTESSFLTTINENAGETVVSLQREVELDTGETVTVEGITPDKMKSILNNGASPEVVTFKTPGEVTGDISGVCQAYNATLTKSEEEIPEVLADNGENPDANGEGTKVDSTGEGEQTPVEEGEQTPVEEQQTPVE